jgi:autotransporter passenger strand-loop-strand repeat protein
VGRHLETLPDVHCRTAARGGRRATAPGKLVANLIYDRFLFRRYRGCPIAHPLRGTPWRRAAGRGATDGISGADIMLANLVSVANGWTLTISSGQTSGGVVVLSGGTLDILSGGTAVGTTVNRTLHPLPCHRFDAAQRSCRQAALPATRSSLAAARWWSSAMALPIRRRSTAAARRPSVRAAPTSARMSPVASRSTSASSAACPSMRGRRWSGARARRSVRPCRGAARKLFRPAARLPAPSSPPVRRPCCGVAGRAAPTS